ncbi:MAG TPA: alpha/beta fold hydrolase [Pirellulaceae bacterium]|nr:alpha/beta fold hydrolase [Pirellulaceae bacterium]
MERINIGSITLNFEMRGSEGPTLLLVHGFPLDYSMWRSQLDELSDSCRVLAPDLRGFGQSDVSPGLVTMQQHADDLAALLDVLVIRGPVVFCGLSMGGYVGWQFWQRHRARVAKLVLCDTKATADTAEGKQGRLDTAQKVLAQGAQVLIDVMLPKLFAPESPTKLPDIVKRTRKVMLDTSREGAAAALRGMAERLDMTSKLKNIDVPTLVICGAHDAIAPVAEMRGIAAAIPGAEFLEVPDAGHMAPLENPAVVNAALSAFIKR